MHFHCLYIRDMSLQDHRERAFLSLFLHRLSIANSSIGCSSLPLLQCSVVSHVGSFRFLAQYRSMSRVSAFEHLQVLRCLHI